MKRGEVVGLELRQWSERGHDGSHKGKQYFSCAPGRGYFTTRDAVVEVLERAEERKARPPSRMNSLDSAPDQDKEERPQIDGVEKGERVRLRNGRTGTVWFIGKTEFVKGTVVGLELDQWAPKGNDGSMKGVRYFECPKGHGYFTRMEAIVEKLGASRRANLRSRRSTPVSSPRRTREAAPAKNQLGDMKEVVKVKIGDRVRLKRGKIGTVRYIGPVEGTSRDVVGLELEQWYERGNDGTFKGVQYFETRGDGWGYFTKPQSIAEIIDPERP